MSLKKKVMVSVLKVMESTMKVIMLNLSNESRYDLYIIIMIIVTYHSYKIKM